MTTLLWVLVCSTLVGIGVMVWVQIVLYRYIRHHLERYARHLVSVDAEQRKLKRSYQMKHTEFDGRIKTCEHEILTLQGKR